MKRKVIQIANSTQLVSLPRKWCLAHNIKKGEEIDVEEQGKNIIISTDSANSDIKTVHLNLVNLSTLRKRLVCIAYLKGYEEINIKYAKPEYIETIQKILLEFPGYDIVHQDKTSCLVKEISKPTKEEFERVFKRLFLLINETFLELINALKNKDKEALASIQFREVSINKFSNFCRRILNKQGYPELDKTSNLYFILMSLEFLGDELKDISLNFRDMAKIPKEYIEILEKTLNLFERVHYLFKIFSIEKAVDNALKRDKLIDQLEILFKQKKDHKIYFNLNRMIQLIIQMQESILGVNV